MTESFAELFEMSQTIARLKPGSIVTGIVVDIRADVVVVHAGLKSEGIVPIEQFYNDQGELDVKLGDEVKVALDSLENGFGETVLSREKAPLVPAIPRRLRVSKWIVTYAPIKRQRTALQSCLATTPSVKISERIALRNCLHLARPERFELPTPKFVAWCSIQLSYGRGQDQKL